MFPALEPFASGLLGVGEGTEIYWEASGNPKGKPAIYLHGGPGSGLKAGYRRQFDPNKFLIVALDQRGCGRSRPLVTDPSYELSTNTTQTMIGDIESLRIHLGVDTWLVNGVSWGTTLALAYAQAHPTRVNSLVLFAVTTTSRGEVDWITEEIGRIFPREWEEYADASGRRPGQRVVDAYAERMADPDGAVRERAAAAWCRWEDVHVSLDPRHVPNPRYKDPGIPPRLDDACDALLEQLGFSRRPRHPRSYERDCAYSSRSDSRKARCEFALVDSVESPPELAEQRTRRCRGRRTRRRSDGHRMVESECPFCRLDVARSVRRGEVQSSKVD